MNNEQYLCRTRSPIFGPLTQFHVTNPYAYEIDIQFSKLDVIAR